MKRLKSILIVVLIFMSGVIVGGIMGMGATMHDFVNKTFRDGPVNIRRVLLQRAKHDLNLDDDQAHQFWEIFNETGAELKVGIAPVISNLQATLARGESRLRNVLKESQKPRFESFMKTAKERWQVVLPSTEGSIETPVN